MAEKIKLGGLWDTETKNGKMTAGTFTKQALIDALAQIDTERVKVAIWPNGYKTEDKQPDFQLYLYAVTPRPSTFGDPPAVPAPITHAAAAVPSAPSDLPTDLPF